MNSRFCKCHGVAIIVTFILVLTTQPLGNATEKPVATPQVETLIESQTGWVGGVSIDTLGYVYIADFVDKVWRFNPATNEIEVFKSDRYGASGNTIDPAGNIYQANFFGNTVDKISRSGDITRVVDGGVSGPVGLVRDADGSLFICSCLDQTVKKLTPEGELSTFASSPHFSCPNGITMDDQGHFYVVSFSGAKIIKVTPDGETSVFADTQGDGVGHIIFLRGYFYATSFLDNKVYRISRTGEVEHFAGTGTRKVEDGDALQASFSNPNGIAVDPSGTYIYINDYLGDEQAEFALNATPFSLRKITLPRLGKTVAYALETGTLADAEAAYHKFKSDPAYAAEETEAEIVSLGGVYMRKKEFDKAMLLFRLATDSHPESSSAWANLGSAYRRIGDTAQAIEALERSLQINPDNPRAKALLELLQD